MNIAPLTNSTIKYRSVGEGIIEGYWNEDNTPFTILCPAQLQEILCHVLNNLDVDKIRIKESKSADTRSADTKVTKEVLLDSSYQHIGDVQLAIGWMITKLRDIAERHDYTKIDNIDEFFNNFKFIQDGNVGEFKQMTWFADFHMKERHHLNDYCPDDVNLFDVLERIADITVAGMARTGKIYDDKLSVEILAKAYTNTIEFIKSNIICSKDLTDVVSKAEPTAFAPGGFDCPKSVMDNG